MNTHNIIEIARWEYRQKARSKGFLFSLILTPVIIVAFGVLPSLLIDQSPDTTELVGLVDTSGSLYAPLKSYIEAHDTLENGQPAYSLVNYGHGEPFDTAIAHADRDAMSDKIKGAIVVRDSAESMVVTYRSDNPTNFRLTDAFEQAIGEIIKRQRMQQAGIDPALYESISAPTEVTPVKLTTEGEVGPMGFLQTFFGAYIGVILFMILILTTGQTLVRSLVEEKSNRIMELLVSSSTPEELMWGKLLGYSGLGVTQVLTWAVLGLGAIGFFGIPIAPEALQPIPFMLLYIVLGYFLFASFFIGFGSLVTTEQEAQLVTQYISMFLVAPLAFAFVVMQNPDASYIQTLSYIPILTPAMMIIRVVTKMPSPLEIISTLAVMLVTTVVVMWAASRVFRTAILMYGKRPSLREIVRWVRA